MYTRHADLSAMPDALPRSGLSPMDGRMF